MAWIRSYQGLSQHPKLRKFARLLGVETPTALGHLHMFWYWVLDYAPDGDITGYDYEDIADAAQWNGDAGAFVNALLDCGPGNGCGFLERREDTLLVHDWDDAQGTEYRKRMHDAEYRKAKRQAKEGTSGSCRGDVEPTSSRRRGDSAATSSRQRGDVVVRERERERDRDRSDCSLQNNPNKQKDAQAEEGEADAKAQQTRRKFQELADAWNTSLAPLGFPKVLKPTPGRMKAFAARLEVAPERESLEWWTQNVLQTMAASEFLTQEARKGANWLTLDWVLNENNLVKVLEGKYSRAQQRTQKPQTVQDAWNNIETDYDKAMQKLRELRGETRRDYIDVEARESDKAGLSGVLQDNAGRRDSNGNAEWQDAGENDPGNVRYLMRLSG